MIKGYAGSYASEQSQCLIQFCFDETTKQFTKRKELPGFEDAKYLSYVNKKLAAVCRRNAAGITLWDISCDKTMTHLSETKTSCFITQDDSYIYTANYHEGTISVYKKVQDLPLIKRIYIQEAAGCHQVLLQENYLLVPCLLLDAIYVLDRRKDFACVHILPFPAHSGPRHGVFTKNKYLYVVSELSNELFMCHMNEKMQGNVQVVQKLWDTQNQKAAAAAIRIDAREKFLYITLREVNQIIVFDRKAKRIVQRLSTMGDHPRDMQLSKDGRFVFVIHRFSHDIRVFERDEKSGLIQPLRAKLHVQEGVCIVFEQEES